MAFGDAHASTPAFVKANSGTKAATCASFTPPAGAIVIARTVHDTAGGNLTSSSALTSSDGTNLTTGGTVAGWTAFAEVSKANDGTGFANGHIKGWWAEATGVAMTVTTTGTNTNNPAGLSIGVHTGAATAGPIDVVAEGTNVNAVVSQLITTLTDGARGFLVASDWNLAANMTAGTSQTALVSDGVGAPDLRFYVGVQNAVTSPAGNATESTGSPSTGNTNNWYAYALKPAAGGGPITVNLGILSETDSMLGVSRYHGRALGQLSETDSIQVMGRSRIRAIAQLQETDSVLAMARRHQRSLGILAETDVELPLSRLKRRTLGQLSETDSMLSLGRARSKILGLLSETSSTQPMGRRHSRTLGLLSEADSVLGLAGSSLGLLGESDALLPMGRSKRRTLGILVETSSVFPVFRGKNRPLGLLTEVDYLLGLDVPDVIPIVPDLVVRTAMRITSVTSAQEVLNVRTGGNEIVVTSE